MSTSTLRTSNRLSPNTSPYLDRNYPDRVFWGDTHVHTSYSTDAGMIGNRLGPDEAYRFAKGEEVTSSIGVRARLARPLDFLVVTDHAENLGLAPMIAESNPDLLKTAFGRKVHDLVKGGNRVKPTRPGARPPSRATTPSRARRAAPAHSGAGAPGGGGPPTRPRFLALFGFVEGPSPPPPTPTPPSSSATARTRPIRSCRSPATTLHDPEDLWQWMAAYEEKTGGRLLAIAHNGNLSNGHMFPDVETLTTRQAA